MGKTTLVNLTTGEITLRDTDPELKARFLGGRGLGAALLSSLVDPSVGPFDPENCLIFTTGPFDGTPWPTSSRYNVTFKSPATGAYGYANAGGHFGPELRRAGHDAVVVTGRAPQPVVLRIVDTAVELVPAGDLWGETTSQVEARLLADGGRVACIGPAGEKLVRIAAIINDGGRAAARGGPGAVMGSKNLKAVHVRATSRQTTAPSGFGKVAGQMSRQVFNNPRTQGLRESTTLLLMGVQNYFGTLPAKNHQVASVPFISTLDDKAFSAYWIERKACAACPIACSRVTQVGAGEAAIVIEGPPEYETTDAFGPMCWNPNPEVVIRANHLCNEYGLDTISTGVTIAFAMECHQRGLLDDPQLSLAWGDPETILGLIERIARRQGLGDLLAEGTYRAARQIGQGAEEFAMQVKGLEMPRQEPRRAKGFGLGHCTSNRGADHLYALPTMDLSGNWEAARKVFPTEMLDQLMNVADETYKPDIVVYSEHFSAVADSLGVCKFSTPETYAVMANDLAAGLRALGYNLSGDDLLAIGERIVNVERMYNVRHGLDRRQDVLPRRFTEQPLQAYVFRKDAETGQSVQSPEPVDTGALIDLQPMLSRYYTLRGWDQDGVPTTQTLERLGLSPFVR